MAGENKPGSWNPVQVGGSRNGRLRYTDSILDVAGVERLTVDALTTSSDLALAQSGSLLVESFRDDVRVNFSKSKGADAITDDMVDAGSVNGTLTHDTTEGRAVAATGAAASNTAYFETVKDVVYEPGHTIRGEMTIEIDRAMTGTDEVRWGVGDDDGAGDIDNGVGWGVDATGLFVWRRKNGTDEFKDYQSSFIHDPLDGSSGSAFLKAGSPVAISTEKNNIYAVSFEWLGAAPIDYQVLAPAKKRFIAAHTDEHPNADGTTLPDPELPLFVRAFNGSGTDIQVSIGSIRGGIITGKVVQQGEKPDGTFVDFAASGASSALSFDGVSFAADENKVSDWVLVENIAGLGFTIRSDQDSATNGVKLEFSQDEVDIERTVQFTYSAAPTGLAFLIPPHGKFVRISYTNTSTPATVHWHTILHVAAPILPLQPIDSPLTGDDGALKTRAVLSAADDITGTFSNILRSTDGGLQVAIHESDVDVPIHSLDTADSDNKTVLSTGSTQLDSSKLTNRRTVIVKAFPGNNAVVFVGFNSSVDSTTGHPLEKGDSVDYELTEDIDIYCRAASGSQTVNIQQLGLATAPAV